MPDSEAMAERARTVAWLRGPYVPDHSDEGGCPFHKAADAIERGDHDYIAIPRMALGDQGAK